MSAEMHANHLLIIILLLSLLTSICACSHDVPYIPISGNEFNSLESRSSDDKSIVDSRTAESIAERFINLPLNDDSISFHKRVINSTAIYNSNGIPVMYAVDFGSNGGYVLISASKKTTPVIASSNSGDYTTSLFQSQILRRYVERAIQKITDSFEYPDDSVIYHNELWKTLLPVTTLKPHHKAIVYSSDYEHILSDIVYNWENQGYEVYDISSWLSFQQNKHTSLAGLEQLLNKMTQSVNWADNRPMKDLCFIIIRQTPVIRTTETKLSSKTKEWNVEAPYNVFVPNGMPLSSESVALGKILYYFNNEYIYKYSSSPTAPLQNDTEVAEFLYNIALKTGTTFNVSYSFATFSNMLTALTNFGFSYNSGVFTQQNIMNSIDNESPTLITEYDSNQRSLTWVCDGYRIISVRYDYFLMAPVGQLEDPFGPYEPAAQWENKSNPNFQIRESSAEDKYFNAFFSPDDPYGNAPKKETNVVYQIKNDENK